tara:strand:- start:42 stop:542 length:501 start_codon:yes stop_codon:yes gene_type:complete
MASILTAYNDKNFGDCECCESPTDTLEYKPIFGVGSLSDTSIFSTSSRPLKFSSYAIDFFNIDNYNIHKNMYLTKKEETDDTDEVFNINITTDNYNCINGKNIGVIRRMTENDIKIDLYHCPKYKLLEILYGDRYQIAAAKIQCITTNIIEEVNISRVVVPVLYPK